MKPDWQPHGFPTQAPQRQPPSQTPGSHSLRQQTAHTQQYVLCHAVGSLLVSGKHGLALLLGALPSGRPALPRETCRNAHWLRGQFGGSFTGLPGWRACCWTCIRWVSAPLRSARAALPRNLNLNLTQTPDLAGLMGRGATPPDISGTARPPSSAVRPAWALDAATSDQL